MANNKKTKQKFLHIPSGQYCRYFKKVRNSSTVITVLFIDPEDGCSAGFRNVHLTELQAVAS